MTKKIHFFSKIFQYMEFPILEAPIWKFHLGLPNLGVPLFPFSPIFGQFSKWIELSAEYTWPKVGENENITPASSAITEKTRKSGFWVPESITVWYERYHHSYTMMMSHLWCQIKSLVLLDLETNKCWNRLCLLPSSSNVNVSLAPPTVSLS